MARIGFFVANQDVDRYINRGNRKPKMSSSTPPDSFVKTVGYDIDKKTTKKQVKYQTVDVYPWVRF